MLITEITENTYKEGKLAVIAEKTCYILVHTLPGFF